MKLNFCSLALQAPLLSSYFQGFRSSWQTLFACAFPELGNLCCGRDAIPKGSRGGSLHITAQNTQQQMGFPGRVWPSQVWAVFHRAVQGHWMDSRAVPPWISCRFFARCGGAVRTKVGQSYQRSVFLPVICTGDAGGRGWQREGEGSSLLQVSGDIPLSQVS